MAKPRDVTLLILDENETKTVKVRRFIVERLNLIIISSITFMVLLILVLFFFAYNFTYTQFIASENKKLLLKNYELTQEIATLNESIEKELGARINELDAANVLVDSIRKYLKNRGVQVDRKLKSLSSRNPWLVKTADRQGKARAPYNKNQLNYLYKSLKAVPLGRPHQGKISSRYGVRTHPVTGKRNAFHAGIDIAGRMGTPVKAAASGVVTFAGTQGGYGRVVIIKNGFGYSTLYGHLSRLNVVNQQKIQVGDVIGAVGNSGRVTGPHLHYEIRKNNRPINPNSYFSLGK